MCGYAVGFAAVVVNGLDPRVSGRDMCPFWEDPNQKTLIYTIHCDIKSLLLICVPKELYEN